MKRAIPAVPLPNNPRQDFDKAVKENLEQIMGQRLDPIQNLSTAATNAQIVSKINEIIDRLQ